MHITYNRVIRDMYDGLIPMLGLWVEFLKIFFEFDRVASGVNPLSIFIFLRDGLTNASHSRGGAILFTNNIVMIDETRSGVMIGWRLDDKSLNLKFLV